MKLKDGTRARQTRFLIIVVTTLGVYLGFRFILPLILPFLFAYFLAWIIRPSTEFLYRRVKLPRIVGGTVSLIVLVGLVGIGLFHLCNTLMKQTVAFIKNLPIYLDAISVKLDSICKGCDNMFGLYKGTMRNVVDDNLTQMVDKVKTNIMPGITQRTISVTITMIAVIGVILIILVSAVLIVKELPAFQKKYENNDFYQDVHRVTEKLADAGVAYLRSQIIIMLMVAVICVLGLTILGNDYALLLGIVIAIMDALPILGSGIVYIPWSIIMLINGNIYSAAILITIFLICQILREVLEPKLIGNRIGIKPLYTLVAMYIGVRLFSIAGFILGPIGLIIIVTVVSVTTEKTNDSHNDKVTYEGE